jgi:hypothetical protein
VTSSLDTVVIVPYSPGPLVPVEDGAPSEPSEVDQLVDELFGPSPEGGPGLLDVALLLAGAGLLLWSLLDFHSTVLTILGIVAIVLGLALPLRSLVRRFSARNASARRQRAAGTGVLLGVTGPCVALVGAYADLLYSVKTTSAPLGAESVAAAHLALLECAELVGDTGPASLSEVEYVERRVQAIRELADAIGRHPGPEDDGGLDRSARALAGEELDASGMSSLKELEDIKRALARPDD